MSGAAAGVRQGHSGEARGLAVLPDQRELWDLDIGCDLFEGNFDPGTYIHLIHRGIRHVRQNPQSWLLVEFAPKRSRMAASPRMLACGRHG